MSKEAWLPIWEKQKIAETYFEATRGGKKTTAKKVHADMGKWLKNERRLDDFPVSLRTVQSIVTELRRPSSPSDEDSKWNVGISKKLGLPPEATRDLLNIWAFSLAAGLDFTIRQAKWVCYLRSVGYTWASEKELSKIDLFNFSAKYANRERICEALGINPIDTSDIDAQLGLTKIELNTAVKTGILDENQLLDLPKELPIMDIKDSEHIAFAYWPALNKLGLEHYIFLAHDVPDETERVFAYWLRYISKAPKWEILTLKEKEEIVVQLKLAIENETSAKSQSLDIFVREGKPKDGIKNLDVFQIKRKPKGLQSLQFFTGIWEPIEVLKAVGYEVKPPPIGVTRIVDGRKHEKSQGQGLSNPSQTS